MVSPNSERNGEKKVLRRRTRQNGVLLFQVFFLLAPLLLPGLRPEKLREKLSRRLPGKTGAAKFYGERVHKLYGLVIRCSNTLSPKHGRVPLTFFPWASISGELPPGHHILRAYNCGWRLLFPALRPPPSIWHGGNRRELTYSRRPFLPLTARR